MWGEAMKLKTRLIIAFCVITIVPFLLFGIAFFGFTQYQMNNIEDSYGVQISFDNLSDSMQVIGKSTQAVFETMKIQAEKDAERFLDSHYLNQINEQLTDKFSYLLVRKGNEIYYNGSTQDVSLLFQELPAFREFKSVSDGGSYIGKDVNAFVKQLDVELEDSSEVSVFIISSVTQFVGQTKVLLRDLVISIVIILVFTALIMTLWIYTGLNGPLKKLSEATHRIKEGDFDFELHEEGRDEISELCRDFEEMRKRLKELDEEKKTFDRQSKELISNISHDLKTPITAVKGYVEGIMDGVADTPEKMDRYVKTIYNKTNEMDHLINELTFYSKIDTNRIPYTFSKLNVEDYFSDCAEEVGLELETRGIELVYANYVESGVQVIADGEQIRRVIHNIISNAIKYMDKPKGIIQIRVKDVGDFIQVEIEDNGKGIAAKDLPSIFDRFYRTDVSRNSSKGGSGIGLSIVKKILEDHGGKVWATSRLGIGTIMYFVLRKYQEVPMNE